MANTSLRTGLRFSCFYFYNILINLLEDQWGIICQSVSILYRIFQKSGERSVMLSEYAELM